MTLDSTLRTSPPAFPPAVLDRRRHRRYELPPLACRVGRERGTILDVSLVGLAVETGEALRIGDRYPITIDLPSGPLSFTVDVSRCRMVDVRREGLQQLPIFHSGLDFRHEIEDRAPELLAFIQENILLAEPDVDGYLRTRQRGDLGRVESCRILSLGAGRARIVTTWHGAEGTGVGLTLRRGNQTLSAAGRVVAVDEDPGRAGTFRIDLHLEPLGCCARVTLGSWIRDQLE